MSVCLRSASLLLYGLILAVPAWSVPVRTPARPGPAKPEERGPTGTPVFSSQVEMVTVDAVVVDKKGRATSGLRKEDFMVFEDGQRQEVTSFEAITVPPSQAARPTTVSHISTNTGVLTRTGRTFAVLVDDIHLDHFQARRAQLAVAEFLRTSVREGDRMTLAAASGAVWWSTGLLAGRDELITMLKRIDGRYVPDISAQDRMTDHEALRIHQFHDTEVGDRVERRFQAAGLIQQMNEADENREPGTFNGYVEARATEVYAQAFSRNRITLDSTERLLKSLAVIKGRKALILVSSGFIYDPNVDDFRDVVEAARRSNVTIYFVDTRGLGGEFSPFTAEWGPPIDQRDIGPMLADSRLDAEGSESLADESGGFSVKNTNDLAAGLARIADESRSYYLLGYIPTQTVMDGRFRRIQVRCNRKGTTVRARKGYYAPVEGQRARAPKPSEIDPEVQQALDAPFEVEGIPLRMTAYIMEETLMGKARVILVAEAHIYNLAFEEKEGRLTDSLDMLLMAMHRETGETYQYPQTIEMKLRPETRQKMPWYSIVREFELPGGVYQARLIVRDQNSRRVGSVIHTFEVPGLADLRISTPILSDTRVPDEASDATPRPALLARRNFGLRETFYCQYEVYNATRDLSSAMPRVTAGYKLVHEGGANARVVEPTLIATPQDRVTRLFYFPLGDLAPGGYERVLNVKDEVSGKALEYREPFVLEAPR